MAFTGVSVNFDSNVFDVKVNNASKGKQRTTRSFQGDILSGTVSNNTSFDQLYSGDDNEFIKRSISSSFPIQHNSKFSFSADGAAAQYAERFYDFTKIQSSIRLLNNPKDYKMLIKNLKEKKVKITIPVFFPKVILNFSTTNLV
jgi:hypothetical protein